MTPKALQGLILRVTNKFYQAGKFTNKESAINEIWLYLYHYCIMYSFAVCFLSFNMITMSYIHVHICKFYLSVISQSWGNLLKYTCMEISDCFHFILSFYLKCVFLQVNITSNYTGI